jgi:hypothetical protein
VDLREQRTRLVDGEVAVHLTSIAGRDGEEPVRVRSCGVGG